MKFTSFLGLEKHLKSAKNTPRGFLILAKDKEERKRLALRLAKKLSSSARWYEEGEFSALQQTLASPSLFGERETAIWETKKGREELLPLSQQLGSHTFLIVSSDNAKTSALFEGITLDLLSEKPWDRDKRLQEDILHAFGEEGKGIAPGALALILHATNSDEAILEEEIKKLLLFVGDKKQVEEKDVRSIVSFSSRALGFQAAEELLWGGAPSLGEIDANVIFSLAGQLRFLLQQARKVEQLLLEKKEEKEIGTLAQIRSKGQLTKLLQRVKRHKRGFIEAAFHEVYQAEKLAKGSSLPPETLLKHLQLQLKKLQNDYTR